MSDYYAEDKKMKERMEERADRERKFFIRVWSVGLLIALSLIILAMYGCPKYKVWSKELSGKAKLKEAEWSRQIAVEEAKAKMQSAASLAEAEIIRAQGVASANLIIGQSLKGNEGYLRYLWIQGLSENDSDVIYVPTEANLPILEATRLRR